MIAAGFLLGQVAVFAPSGYVGVLSVGDRSEVRLRSTLEGGTALDLETTPNATMRLNGRRSDLVLAYAPRFAYLDIEHPSARTLVIANAGRLAAGWTATHRLRLTLGATGTLGTQVSAGLLAPTSLGAPTTTTPSTFVAAGTVISTETYRLDAGAAYRLSSRWSLLTGASYGGGRGRDPASSALFPAYHGPSALAAVSHDLTRHDVLTTRASAALVHGVRSSEYSSVTLMEIWSRSWTARTTSSLGAGVAVYRIRDPEDTAARTEPPFPVGDATLTHVIPLRSEETLALGAVTRVTVTYDPVLRSSTPQAAGILSSTWTHARVSVTTSVDAVSTLPGPDAPSPARQLAATLLASYAASRGVRLETGLRAYVQRFSSTPTVPDPPDTRQWAVFVGVSADAPILDF